MRKDEEGTLAGLIDYRQLIDRLALAHGGRTFGAAGDSMLAEFSSPVEAVRCAINIQSEVTEINTRRPEGSRMQLRIGVNLGDVMAEGENLYGDGVNVAARMESLSEPGGMCVSGSAFEQVRDRVDIAFSDMGDQEVKNIDRPVRAWQWRPQAGTTAPAQAAEPLPDKPAIAVLPFTNMSADPEQEYFSDGLTEDIITALTHWRSFPVIARNSCFAYKNKPVDITQVARDLGAGYVLEGSVRKGGARVRITAQLVDGASGHHLWAEKYDRKLDDIFAVQDDIVQRIAALVAPELAKVALKRSTGKPPQDLDAWDLYLRGMASIHARTADANARARDMFASAIAIRPGYSDAHAGIALSYNQDLLYDIAGDRTATAARSIEAARKAVECDGSSSWAHHELSNIYQLLNRLDEALAENRIAVDLNPNNAEALHGLGNKCDLAGDPDGIAFMEKAQKLNPEDAHSHAHPTFQARAYVNIGDHGAAVERTRLAIRRRPDYAPAYYILAIALGHLGKLDEARAALTKCDEISPGFVRSRQDWQPYADPNQQRAAVRGSAPDRRIGAAPSRA